MKKLPNIIIDVRVNGISVIPAKLIKQGFGLGTVSHFLYFIDFV